MYVEVCVVLPKSGVVFRRFNEGKRSGLPCIMVQSSNSAGLNHHNIGGSNLYEKLFSQFIK